jgi:hypothetical protein
VEKVVKIVLTLGIIPPIPLIKVFPSKLKKSSTCTPNQPIIWQFLLFVAKLGDVSPPFLGKDRSEDPYPICFWLQGGDGEERY